MRAASSRPVGPPTLPGKTTYGIPVWRKPGPCSSCQTAFKLLVVVEEQKAAVTPVKEEPSREPRRNPVSMDDVLDAHSVLRDFSGDVNSLFKRPTAKRERRV